MLSFLSNNSSKIGKKARKTKDNGPQNFFTLPSEIQLYTGRIIGKSQELGNHCRNFRQRKNDFKHVSNENLETFTQWLPFYQEACDIDLMKGELEFIQIKNKNNLGSAPSLEILFKSYNFFEEYTWPVRFSSQFVRKFVSNPLDMNKYIVGLISRILNGYLYDPGTQKVSRTDCPCHMEIFTRVIGKSDRHLLFYAGVEQIPRLNSDKTFQQFNYIQVIQFADIVSSGDVQSAKLDGIRLSILEDIKKDSARSCLENFAILKQHNLCINSKYQPKKFEPRSLIREEFASIKFDPISQRWKIGYIRPKPERNTHNYYNYDYTAYNKKVAEEKKTFQEKANFEDSTSIVEFLQKIPNFKIRLTAEQNEVVGHPNNIVALGRSGTGKTTCAILRLFAIEVLFKYRMTLAKARQEKKNKDIIFGAEQVDASLGLHSIFVTASPVLSNEVQRYYQKLTGQVKDELKKKQERLLEKKRKEKTEQQKETDQNTQSQKTEDDAAVESREAAEAVKLAEEGIKDIQIENLDLEDDEELLDEEEADNELLKRMDRFSSLHQVEEKAFPLFLTVKKLVMLIDGCLYEPFFVRNRECQVIGLDSNAQWHTETKGVMMIRNYYRKIQDEDKPAKKAGHKSKEDSEISSSDSGEDEVDEEDYQREYNKEVDAHIKEKKKEQARRGKKHSKFGFEIDYEYFVNHFWNPMVMKEDPYLRIPPVVVWGEIQSHIKGSAYSHTSTDNCLSESKYCTLENEKKSLLTKEMKVIIYDIFIRYERWKHQIRGYDLMDVVNHAIRAINSGKRCSVPIHYLMIDEVQDLTHATIYLFMKVTSYGVFLSGDTAQTIAKGASVRFSDLQNLFEQINEYMKPNYGYNSYNNDYNTYIVKKWRTPTIKQLTVNFRSHGKILELANSVVTLIETFFPRTIDKLKKEKSTIDGPKPILLDGVELDVLFALLFGTENDKSAKCSDAKDNAASSKVEFGCNQVVLVRDQESKDKLPPLLKHALVLTVFEAKGLEFDDVILYNFFSDSAITSAQWRLLESVTVEDIEIDKFQYHQEFFTSDENKSRKVQPDNVNKKVEQDDNEDEIDQGKFNQDSVQLFNASLDSATSKYMVKKVGTKINRKRFDIHPYSLLCTELKQLYVAITRPKSRLIIYDEFTQSRRHVENFWRSLDLVQFISKKDLDTTVDADNKDVATFRSLVAKTSTVEWRKQGVRMFKNKYYEQAAKCFEKSGDEAMRMRAQAYSLAEKTSSKVSEIHNKRVYIKEGVHPYDIYPRILIKSLLRELKRDEASLKKDFLQAAQLFETINLLKQAARCYFSAEKYEKALTLYVQIGQIKQAAEAAYMLKNYQMAAEYYDQANDYIKTIDCLNEIKQYERILEVVNKHKTIPDDQRKRYAKKYVPLALKALVMNIDYDMEDLEDRKDEKKSAKDKIEEVSEGEEEDESKESEQEEEEENRDEDTEQENSEEAQEENSGKATEDELIDESRKPENEKVESHIEESKEQGNQNLEKIRENISSISFTQIEAEKPKQATKVSKEGDLKDSSFEVINGTKSNSVIAVSFDETPFQAKTLKNRHQGSVNEMSFEDVDSANTKDKNLEDFNHLSHIDPEDEWLQMESGSIVEQLSAIRRKESKSGSATYSEYSAIDFNHVMDNQCVLVKTKVDIFAQDVVMQKIIRYIGMFSEDVKQSLANLRSKRNLLSQKDNSHSLEEESLVDMMMDLDEISTDFIYLILDLLEYYKLHKLCIFVCNRYGLSQKLGRYLVNIATTYSNLATESIMLNKAKLTNPIQRQMQNEKAFVASVALHNVLENINPAFLHLKKKNEKIDFTNSLGNECFSQLINLGFWKKCLFLMDYDNSLALASTFASFKNYKLIYLKGNETVKVNNVNSLIATESFEFLPFKTPETPEDMKCSFIALDAVIWDLTEKLPLYLQNDSIQKLELPAFPSFFAFNGVLWNFIYHKSTESTRLFENYFSEALTNLEKIMHNKNFSSPMIELRIYDLILFFMQIMILHTKVPELKEHLLNLNDYKYEQMINLFNDLLVITNSILRTSKYHETIIRALITPYRVRVVESCQVLEHMTNNYFVTHISSPLASEMVGKKASLYEYPLVSPLLVDLEPNFLATPMNTVLTSIRKRLLTTMKIFVTARMKHVLAINHDDCVKKLEDHLHMIELIECYRFAVSCINKSKDQNNSHYKSFGLMKNENFIKDQIKNELVKRYNEVEDIEHDDDFEPEEKEIMIADVQKEIKQVKDYIKEKAIKVVSEPFEAQKLKYLDVVKKSCREFRKCKLRLNHFAKQAIFQHFLKKIHDGILEGKLNIAYIHLFHMLGLEVYLAEILRRYKYNPTAKTVQTYNDSVVYRSFYCIKDYSHNLISYMSESYSSLGLSQKVYLVEDLSLMTMITMALNNKTENVTVTEKEVTLLDRVSATDVENSYVLEENIVPFDSQHVLEELINWIEKVSIDILKEAEDFGPHEINDRRIQLTKTIILLIVNNENIAHEQLKKLKYSLKNLIGIDQTCEDSATLLKYINSEDGSQLSRDIRSSQIKLSFNFVSIALKSNLNQAKIDYKQYDQARLNEQMTIARHINLKKAILKLYSRSKFPRIKEKINFDYLEHNYILAAFRSLTDHKFVLNNVFELVRKNSALLQPFYEINNLLKRVMFFFYYTKLENSLDFHYITSLLQTVSKIGLEYVNLIRELTISQEFNEDNNKIFETKREKISELLNEFEEWKDMKESKEDLDQKQRRKKMIGVKWEAKEFRSALMKKVKKSKS